MSTREPLVKGLDVGPESDPEWIYSQPPQSAEEFDPSQTDDPYARKLMIDLRRSAGLPDYPEPSTGRDAAD
jgi:hypothetical protein